ncbi:MAG: uracil-DNA glycosylase family protein [Phycisphaerales bacterium]
MRLPQLLADARACTTCAAQLPHEPRSLLQAAPSSRILIIGQAPGAAAHASGIPWDDRSGQRLRDWLALTPEQFYDPRLVALMPMGFCFPGSATSRAGAKSADLAPRAECAPQWHPPLLAALKRVELTIYLGQYAFARYLADEFDTITAAARAFTTLLPTRLALPHPSPRNNLWLKKHPWFEAEALAAIRTRVRAIAATGVTGS